MASYKPRELEKALLKKGFEKDNRHHKMLWLHVNGKKTAVRTRISHDGKDYGDQLLGEMKKQVRLPKAEFNNLIECPLSRDEYVAYLCETGILKGPEPDGD